MTTSREFLELALSGEELTAAHLDALKTEQVKEDESIDYKSGAILKDRKKAARTVREYLSGFANSDGGVLVIGIEEVDKKPSAITGCDAKDVGGDLGGWAARCVTELGAYFSPFPRFMAVEHSGVEVLVCAVARSYNMVPVIEEGRPAYHFRLGDQMLRAPDYLLADLLLGRRARPILEVRGWVINNISVAPARNGWGDDLLFHVQVDLENAGLVWAENSKWGVIQESIVPSDFMRQPLPSYLHTAVDCDPIESREGGKLWKSGWQFHRGGDIRLEKPFDVDSAIFRPHIPLAYGGAFAPYKWHAAMYLMAKNSAPVWYQITLSIDSELLPHLNRPKGPRLPRDWEGFSITKVHNARPVVGWIQAEEVVGEEGVD